MENNILSAFKHTGIEPLDRSVVLKRFEKRTPEMSPERESSTSVLSGDDWRAIDRLVRSTAANSNSIQCQKLRSSLHHILVQNQMLQVEVDGLRDVIGTKKRHNKKSKPLDLQQHQEYHGGAVFWSPRALKEARWRERVRQQEERAEEL